MSGQALAVRDPLKLGEVMHRSRVFADLKSADMAVVKILAGEEFGLGPVAAMSSIHIIDGKPVPAAGLAAGQVKRHPSYDFYRQRLDDEACKLLFVILVPGATIKFTPHGESEEEIELPGTLLGESEFTMAHARQAGLAGRRNWKSYPRNMLFARAVSNGVRWYCPDVVQGVLLTKEEAEDIAEEGAVRVENQATAEPAAGAESEAVSGEVVTGPPSAEELRHLNELYVACEWKEPDAVDPHALLRITMGSIGVRGTDRPIPEIMQGMSRDEFTELESKLRSQVEASIQHAMEQERGA